MSRSKGKVIKLSEKTYNAELNKAYLEGYETGYKTGLADGEFMNKTLNQKRAELGLPPINNTEVSK